MKSRATEAVDDDHRRLQAKIGELLMETELLYAKVDQLEAGRPLARAVRAWRRFCPCVANDRLRHILIGYARVSKADGSHPIVTDRLPSYRAAMKVIGNEGCQETRRWLNNRTENSHQPFRRREGAMARFRDIKTLQKFTSVHASIHNHFNHQRHLNRRDIFKQGRAAALAEWRQLAV